MANENRFDGMADDYAKYRPSYSSEAISYILESNNIKTDGIVVDVGCGTGILSEQFLKKGMKVYGVEPNDDMRRVAERRLDKYKDFFAVYGCDSDFGDVPTNVDLVVCAQAFHWFDVNAFKQECKRVLKPEGKVGIFYADFDPEAEMTPDIRKLNYQSSTDKGVAWKVKLAYSQRFLSKFFRGVYLKVYNLITILIMTLSLF